LRLTSPDIFREMVEQRQNLSQHELATPDVLARIREQPGEAEGLLVSLLDQSSRRNVQMAPL
jgi:hypothetical protein